MELLIHFIGLLAAVWLFTEGADPIQFIKGMFNVANDSDPKTTHGLILQKLLNCCLCMGFWVGLFYYDYSITMAALTSISAEMLCRTLKKIFN